MKKLVFSAAALTLTGTALANDSDWAQLDQDIQALSASLQGAEGVGLNIGGRIRAVYANSGDIAVSFDTDGDGDPTNDPNPDVGGFSVYNARLFAHGTTDQNIGYRLEVDFANTGLLDAYLDIPVGEQITIRAGQFRGHVTREALIDSGDIFFFDRSRIAAGFAGRNQGVAAMGAFDAFDWAVTIQNGLDGVGDDLMYAVRGEIDVMGNGTGLVEGAFGNSEEMEATVGVAYFDDGAANDTDGFVIDGHLATNQFSAQVAIISTGDGGVSGANADPQEGLAFGGTAGGALPGIGADATAFSVAGTFKLTESTSEHGAWEVGARFQDLDNAVDTTILDVGVNYYEDGHDMKYILGFTSVSADSGAFDGTIIRVGVQSRF